MEEESEVETDVEVDVEVDVEPEVETEEEIKEEINEEEAEKFKSKRAKKLSEGINQMRCPVCGSKSAYVRLKDGAIMCRKGHITEVDGTVKLSNGIETTLKELREKKLVK